MLDSFFAWLSEAAAPIAKRVLAGLGFGVASFAAVSTVLTNALDTAATSLGQLGADVLAILAISGMFDALAIMSGGILGSLAWMQVKRLALLGSGGGVGSP